MFFREENNLYGKLSHKSQGGKLGYNNMATNGFHSTRSKILAKVWRRLAVQVLNVHSRVRVEWGR